ncbi:MAG: hypothetical protein KIH64_008600 [Mycobacterium sp.]|nr:hypothetical protein [Mycobacterium sp.]
MKTTRKAAIMLGALAVIGMGGVTVACSPAPEKSQEMPATSVTAPSASPSEKALQTNVTRAPISAAPAGVGGGGNAAVPCGFGPSGGARCGNNG